MNRMLKKINQTEQTALAQYGYLIIRVCFGLMLATHGWSKVSHFNEYAAQFANPFGLGERTSLILTIFAEFVCAILIALGFFTRLASIPVVINFLTIFFIIHGSDPFGDKELAAAYLALSIGTLLIGSGKISIDRKLGY